MFLPFTTLILDGVPLTMFITSLREPSDMFDHIKLFEH